MQMNTGFDGSMIDQLLETAEEKKEKEDEELEIDFSIFSNVISCSENRRDSFINS